MSPLEARLKAERCWWPWLCRRQTHSKFLKNLSKEELVGEASANRLSMPGQASSSNV